VYGKHCPPAFCLGVSSAGMSAADYTRLTYDLTLSWLAAANPAMTFVYASGAGTSGKAMWAQIKGTEDALLAPFPNGYMFRWPCYGLCTVRSRKRAGRGPAKPSFVRCCRWYGRSRRRR
jgi:hypothetical protein